MTSTCSVRAMPFAAGALRQSLGTGRCVEYLIDYLTDLGARSMLEESHYVDRHFLDDFAAFYSRSFFPPPAACSRWHFFGLPDGELIEALRSASRGTDERDAAERRLRAAYLGFTVRRPLVGAEIGRTVLRTYPGEGRRHFTVVRPYRVHVAGLQLEIDGLAFQQQDGGAAVCASTALWSALQKVAHLAGHRTPTPSEVTAAARSPFPPNHGLDYTQIAAAISQLGYIADQFEPRENPDLFRAKLIACLDSHLPVILMLTRQQGGPDPRAGHAVTVTGYALTEQAGNVRIAPEHTMTMSGPSLKTLYVHDDNLGSHAHYELYDPVNQDTETHGSAGPPLMLQRGSESRTPAWWKPDHWVVECALVPKPAKLRMPIESLLAAALGLVPGMAKAFDILALDLRVSVRFEVGVTYRRSLVSRGLDPESLAEFQESLSLPRFIAVVGVATDGESLCEVVLDVTDVHRRDAPVPGLAQAAPTSVSGVRAIVAPGLPAKSTAARNLDRVFGCPIVTAPQRRV